MAINQIVILNSNPVTGKLDLSDGGTTRVGRGGRILWTISNHNVTSFQIIKKPGTSYNIFTQNPERSMGTSLSLNVGWFIRSGDWYYSIVWKDTDNITHTYDPKIAVKPLVTIFEILLIIILSAGGLLTILNLLRKRRNH